MKYQRKINVLKSIILIAVYILIGFFIVMMFAKTNHKDKVVQLPPNEIYIVTDIKGLCEDLGGKYTYDKYNYGSTISLTSHGTEYSRNSFQAGTCSKDNIVYHFDIDNGWYYQEDKIIKLSAPVPASRASGIPKTVFEVK